MFMLLKALDVFERAQACRLRQIVGLRSPLRQTEAIPPKFGEGRYEFVGRHRTAHQHCPNDPKAMTLGGCLRLIRYPIF